MKTIGFLIALLVAILAWFGALVDCALARISYMPRPYLVPDRTFYAVYRVSYAYLMGNTIDWQTFRIRESPRRKYF